MQAEWLDVGYRPDVPRKYLQITDKATMVHHRGISTLPGEPPETSSGEIILCLHDAGGNGNAFSEVLDQLSFSHTPVAYDQPGHARSAGLDSLGSLELMADHAEELCLKLAAKRVILVGDGLGAVLAFEIAARGNIDVHGIVAFGDLDRDYDLRASISELEAITSGKARRQFDQSGYSPNVSVEAKTKAFTEWVKTDPRTTVEDLRALSNWDGENKLSHVACPVLLLIGEHTEETQTTTTNSLALSLTKCEISTISDSGRRLLYEAPVQLADAVTKFCSSVGASK
jgi:pimeloyl-ACP methyl ester carboxylesterase|tara:strand:+ start:2012 stop:2866 length:855 start_codon:yes stop_codon:yes gene_type:complete